MRSLLRRETGLLIGLALLVGLSWLGMHERNPLLDPPALAVREEVDGYLTHFVITAMGEDGQPNHRLAAKKMVLFSGTGLSQVDQPFLTLYQKDNNPWLIRAEHGLVQTDSDVVFLTGNVRMTQENVAGHVVEILTEKLEVQTRRHYAVTEHKVSVTHHQGWVTGVGMQVYLNEGRLSLLEQVSGHYEVP